MWILTLEQCLCADPFLDPTLPRFQGAIVGFRWAWDAIERWQVLTFVPIILIGLQLFAIFSVFHAIRYVRTSQAAVAWTVALLTIPVLALPLYWVFARHRFEGYREAIRDVGQRHQDSVMAARRELVTERFARSTEQKNALEWIADTLDTPTSSENQFELLIDGEAFFDAMLSLIDEARQYIYLELFIIRADRVGQRVADALIRRAKEGVVIRLLYDEVGCISLSKSYLRRLADHGIDVRPFNTRQGWMNRFQINFRNHRKVVIIDGHAALVGGLNIGEEYLGPPIGRPPWRDTAVGIRGPLARKCQAVFAGDYYWAARHDLPEAIWKSQSPRSNAEVSPGRSEHGPADSAVCATGPADLRPRATMMFGAAATAAQYRLWISTPYLVPDEACQVALHMAKARGVDVRILIPMEADHWAVYLAGFHYEQELAEAGIPVFRYQAGFMHQKCILVDDDVALIGSTNLDNRSLYLNFELMVAVSSSTFVESVRQMLENDFHHAIQSNTSGTPPRWWFARMGTAIARLFSPVL